MTLRKKFELECDGCGAVASVYDVPAKQAVKLFRRAKWVIGHRDGEDLCPPCSRLPGDGAVAIRVGSNGAAK